MPIPFIRDIRQFFWRKTKYNFLPLPLLVMQLAKEITTPGRFKNIVLAIGLLLSVFASSVHASTSYRPLQHIRQSETVFQPPAGIWRTVSFKHACTRFYTLQPVVLLFNRQSLFRFDALVLLQLNASSAQAYFIFNPGFCLSHRILPASPDNDRLPTFLV